MFLIVGLGNPGKEYEWTRHNLGHRAIDRISKDLGISVTKGMCRALTGQGSAFGHKIILAKPQTYMNLSGESVLELLQWFKIESTKLIVIYDDLDTGIGDIRLRPKGNSGGHKGIESVIDRLGTTDFARIRIGIGRPIGRPLEDNGSEYVLSRVPKEEMEEIDASIVSAAEAAMEIVKNGLDAAMNKYNKS